MSYIVEWVRNIFIIVAAVSFIKFLLPGSSMGKYLNFILSLMILAVILYPLALWKDEGINVSEAVPYYGAQSADGESQWNDQQIDNIQTKQIQQVYKEKVESLIKDAVESEFSGIRVLGSEIYINNEENAKQMTGGIWHVTVYISDAEYEKHVRELVASTLSIKKDKVTVRYMEG